jgi:S1-C subfamily serine protease
VAPKPLPTPVAQRDQPSFVVQVRATSDGLLNGTFVKGIQDWGSGSLIDPTHVLTVAHGVPLNVKEIVVIFKNGDEVKAKAITVNRLYDVAILELETVRYETPVVIGPPAKDGDTYTIHGFPTAGPHVTKTGKVKESRFFGTDDPLKVLSIFELTALAKDGDSGGPVLDSQKRLRGMVSSSFPNPIPALRGTQCVEIEILLRYVP